MKAKINLTLLLVVCISINSFSQSVIETIKKDYEIENWIVVQDRANFDLKNIKEKGIKPFEDDSSNLLTGYSYGEFYDWDLYFENIYLSYFGVSEYCFSNLKSFLKRQELSGFVSRTLKVPRPKQHFKPFLAQIALLGSRQTNDYTWLLEEINPDKYYYPVKVSYYERLKRYIDYWFWYQDFDKNGLPVWNSSDHSGMDNQITRAGTMNAFTIEGVDLACYLYRELKAMELIASKLGFTKDSKEYGEKSDNLAATINKVFWDDKDKFYYDRTERTGQLVKVKSVAGFMPLFIGIATKDRAESLIKLHLLNKNEFWLSYPVASYAKTEPDYSQQDGDGGSCNWLGTTWIPTNYMIFHGLIQYGYNDIAKELAKRTFEMVLKNNDVTREYYNAETGNGLGLKPFWGWSTLGYMMPLELELKYNPMEITDKPILKIGKDYLGIEMPE